ncbi:MAG: protease modulator HflC [Gammaproteobacteria bacterium]|nr:protease modulator HflC [Gammaproteobacteria bacterium]
MSIRNMLLAAVVIVVAVLAYDVFFTVNERQRALVLRFGEITQVDLDPGLHFKLPIADDAKKFDGRIQTLDSPPERYFTLEKKPLVVDSFVKWRVSDVQTYYETTEGGDQRRAELLLSQRVNEGLRNQISRRDMHEVISGERDQLMADLTQQLNNEMRRDVGVDVIDVRVKRIDLPPEVSAAVYDRMNSEREIEAQQYRATGREVDLGIRADADRQVVVVEAEAYREAEQIRGDGDAGAAAIYAEAYGADPEFYEFYRSINAYVSVFSQKGDLLIVDPNSEFFKYLKDGDG